jgi:hypothetical protein
MKKKLQKVCSKYQVPPHKSHSPRKPSAWNLCTPDLQNLLNTLADLSVMSKKL